MNGTSVGDETAKAIEGMQNVWSFCADYSQISDAGLMSLGRMPALSLVSLNATQVRGHGLGNMSELDGLQIYLEDCRVTDEGAEYSLRRMKQMRLLSLSKTLVTDRAMESIGACRRLEDLRLSDTGVTDATLELLTKLPSLQILYIERTRVSSDRVVRLKSVKHDLTIYSDFHDEC